MRTFRNVNLNLPGAMISLPVSIAKATGSSDFSAKTVGPDGGDLRQVYLDTNGDEVERDDTKRAIEGKVISQEELSEVNEQCKLTDLDILEICPLDAVNSLRVSGSYYIYTNKKAGNTRAFNVFVQALKKLKSAAVVKWTPSSRQQLLVLRPEGDALVGVAVCFEEDWREADEDVLSHTEEKATKEEVDLASQLLKSVAGDGASLINEKDEAIQLKKDILAGREVAKPSAPIEQKPADDLVASLEAALEEVKTAA